MDPPPLIVPIQPRNLQCCDNLWPIYGALGARDGTHPESGKKGGIFGEYLPIDHDQLSGIQWYVVLYRAFLAGMWQERHRKTRKMDFFSFEATLDTDGQVHCSHVGLMSALLFTFPCPLETGFFENFITFDNVHRGVLF